MAAGLHLRFHWRKPPNRALSPPRPAICIRALYLFRGMMGGIAIRNCVNSRDLTAHEANCTQT